MTLFVVANIFMFNLGYRVRFVIKKPEAPEILEKKKESVHFTQKIRILFRVSCILTIVFQIVWVILFLGQFNVFNVIDNIGFNYYERLNFEFEGTSLIMQIRTLFWGVTLFAYPIGFMFIKKMNLFDKMLLFLTITTDVIASLNMGINKNIGDIVIVFIAYVLVSGTTFPKLNYLKERKNELVKIVFVIVAFAVVFGVVQTMRKQVQDSSLENPFYEFSEIRKFTPFDFLTFGIQPLTNTVDHLGTYVSHAYTGLAFALELPFENTYGIGFSRSLMEYADQYLGIKVSHLTYNSRVGEIYGWPDGMYWPTAFTWIANSVSFWFVPLLIYFFGAFFSSVVTRFIIHKDIVSLVLLCQLFIGSIYLSANAQLVQSRASLFGTVFLLIAYFSTSGKYKCH